jgi:hypothetical protein
MLIVCAKLSQLADALLEENATSRLLEQAQRQNFDIASTAFSVIKELLLQQGCLSNVAQGLTRNVLCCI